MFNPESGFKKPEDQENPQQEVEQTQEKEKNPEAIVANAISAIENRDSSEQVLDSYWAKATKDFVSPSENWKDFKSISKLSGAGIFWVAFIGLGITYRILEGVFKFTKKAIEKKGNVGIGEGYKIGKEMSPLGDKKDNKK